MKEQNSTDQVANAVAAVDGTDVTTTPEKSATDTVQPEQADILAKITEDVPPTDTEEVASIIDTVGSNTQKPEKLPEDPSELKKYVNNLASQVGSLKKELGESKEKYQALQRESTPPEERENLYLSKIKTGEEEMQRLRQENESLKVQVQEVNAQKAQALKQSLLEIKKANPTSYETVKELVKGASSVAHAQKIVNAFGIDNTKKPVPKSPALQSQAFKEDATKIDSVVEALDKL